MTYRILSTGKGVIINRMPETVENKIIFDFERAPEHATAIFTFDDGTSYYRDLCDGRCSITKKDVAGCIGVALAILDGKTPVARWECEGVKAEKYCDGYVTLVPDDSDLPSKFVSLQMELEEERLLTKKLIENIDELKKEIRQFREEFDRLYKGYQVI
jgi:hypothetical protein